jgi:translocation and assembly module TamB
MADAAKPRTRRQRALSLVFATLAVLMLVPALLLAAAAWLLYTDDGLQWLAARVPGLVVQGLVGRPYGGPMEAAHVEWRGGHRRLTIDGLGWRDATWRWRPHDGAWVGLDLDAPRATRVEYVDERARAPGASRPQPPAQLRLPVELTLRDLNIGALQVGAAPALSNVRADAHLGADGGAAHEVTRLSLRSPWGEVGLQGRIGTASPLPLQAAATLSAPPQSAMKWHAGVDLQGPLETLALAATLSSDAGAQVRVRATVSPFAAWPLGALEADTHDLDLAALAPGLPATRLAGRAVVQASGRNAPARIEIDLTNALSGRWSEARVPVHALHAVLAGRPDERDRIAFETFDMQLRGTQPAGRVTGSGRWQGDRLELALSLAAVQPQRLDARAPPMTLDGPLSLDLHGLPSPGGGATARPPWSGTATATLSGRLPPPRQALPIRIDAALSFEAAADMLHVGLDRFDATAGPSRATGSVALRRDAQRRWTLAGRGELARFDPAPWWPAQGVLRRGPSAVDARWQAALSWPERLALPRLQGRASATIAPSRLAGVPLEGRATVEADGAGAATVDADVGIGRNRLQASGRTTPTDRDDRLRVALDAPALAELAPIAAVLPAVSAWLPQAGAATARATVDGRWPAIRTEGELRAEGLRSPTLQADRVDARWSFAGLADAAAPLSLNVQATGIAAGGRQLDRLEAALTGTLASHRLTLDAATPARPPAWTDPWVGTAAAPANGKAPTATATATTPATATAASTSTSTSTATATAASEPAAATGTLVRLAAEGRWRREADGSAWQGRLQHLRVAGRGTDALPWAVIEDVELQLRLDGDGRPIDAAASPGRVELLGAALRWREARWRGGAAPALSLDAELEPLRVAPWLARLQPAFGWGGDLAVRGRLRVARAARFEADLVVERAGGDLAVTDESGTQTLGLTDLRLSLAATGGTWHFTQALAGANIGVLAGAQSLRVDPAAAWPPPDTPLEGVLELRVANLAVWAPWVPPGWRLGGRLHTSASLGGRFAAPEYRGQVEGSELAVRNLLEGVDVRDGELAVTLRGADATIERFVLHGGDGELRLTGGATFGAAPRAQLKVHADRFRALGRVDRRIVVSGDADVALAERRLDLDGRVAVDEGLVDVSRADAPSLDGDVVVRRRGAAAPAQAPAASKPPPRRALPPDTRVSLRVGLGERLRLRGRGLDTRLAGDLHITAPNGRIAVDGTVRAVDGTYVAYGQKLAIERGAIVFSGDVANPRLDIEAVRPDLDVRVGVAVGGGVQSPRVRLFSEPEMGELDKLSWLVMGRASEGLGRADTALLQRAAIALLAGEGGGPTDAVLKNLGLDELSVRQAEDGTVRETVVTVGKQLSQRWYVGYERGVNATAGTWQLIYRVARRFTLRAQGGADNALDVIWTWRWNPQDLPALARKLRPQSPP